MFEALYNDKTAGFGHNTAITKHFIAKFQPQLKAEPLPTKTQLNILKEKHDDLHALGWWLTMKGNRLK